MMVAASPSLRVRPSFKRFDGVDAILEGSVLSLLLLRFKECSELSKCSEQSSWVGAVPTEVIDEVCVGTA